MGIIMAQIHKTRGVVGSILHTSKACHLNMGVIMNMKKIKAVKEAIGMMNSVSGTIAQAIVHVNLTSTGAPLITGKFNRRAALAAELVNVLAALEAEQENNDTRERCGNDVEAAHAEALEINAQVNEELCKLARVIAGVNRSTYKHETKAQLIGAACAGVVDGLRERVEVVLSRDRLAETVARAVGASK